MLFFIFFICAVFPNGFTILADLGETKSTAHKKADYVANKLETLLGSETKRIDVGIVSHLHMDHIGHPSYGGLRYLIEKKGYTFGQFIDRDAGVWDPSKGKCNESTITYHNIGTTSNVITKWICYATNPNSTIYSVRETAKVGSRTQINPGLGKDAEILIVSGDAKGGVDKDGNSIEGDLSNSSCTPNENDYSIGFILRFKKFTYGFFGDLDGAYHSSYGICYNDVENAVLDRLIPLDVYNVNHHGSAHSSSDSFVDKIQPTVSVFSCGKNNSYGHPHQEVVDKLLKYGDIYLTEDGNSKTDIKTGVVADGDVVLSTTESGERYKVTAGTVTNEYVSKGSVFPDSSASSLKCWPMLVAIVVIALTPILI